MNSKKYNLIGVDVGYGWTKAATTTQTTLTESVIGPAQAISYVSELAAPAALSPVITYQGQSWFVGQQARVQSLQPISPQAKGRSLDVVVILALSAMAQLITDEKPISMVTGLPMQWFDQQHAELQARMLGEHHALVGGTHRVFNVEAVKVVPQHAGTLYREMINEQGVLEDRHGLAKSAVGIADLGEFTFGACRFDELVFNQPGSQSTSRLSAGKIYASLQAQINERYDLDLGILQVKKAARRGYISKWGKSIDITNLIQESAKATALGCVELCKEVWGVSDAYKTFQLIAATGGGMNLIGDTFKAAFPNARLVERPQTANVEGMLRLALLRSRHRGG